MPLPTNTALLCQFLLGRESFPDDTELSVTSRSGVVSIDKWDAVALGRAEPTEQELTDALNGATLINGQTFAQWHDEHGNDAIKTRRRIAKQRAAEATREGVELRALIELFNMRDNYLTNRIMELQAALDAVKASLGGAVTIRDAIPARWMPTTTRDRSEAMQDYLNAIDGGVAD